MQKASRQFVFAGIFCTLLGSAIAAAPTPPKPNPPAPTPSPTPTPQPRPATAPASISLGASATKLAADGNSAIIATLKNADGSLFTSAMQVSFSSSCASLGTAVLDRSVNALNGIAAANYQVKGCAGGADTVTATVGTGSSALKASLPLLITSNKALSARASVGRAMFFDKSLSAAGNLACASCHSAANAYLAPDQFATPLGGATGKSIGFRSAPSAAYAALTPPFAFLGQTNKDGTANNGANGKLGTPRRGLMWDGRASTVFDQAKGPFLGAHEMANANSAAVLKKLLAAPYLASFNAAYGNTTASSNADTVLTNMANAIAQFETEDKSFALFNSKFDAVQSNTASFTAQELNGQALFSNPNKGACLGCHSSNSNLKTVQGPQMFTDLSYRTIAVPRNWNLPYNNDATVVAALQSLNMSSLLNGAKLGAPNHQYYDLGFCGPFRTDSLNDASLCGAFRVPSLRNVALKGSYFHNGVYNSLGQVVNFYMTRDSQPQQIYKKADGSADIAYNDLPVIYQKNREVRPPFTPANGGGPRLTPTEVQDLIAFMCTLTDGYDPQKPESYQLPAQCKNAVRR